MNTRSKVRLPGLPWEELLRYLESQGDAVLWRNGGVLLTVKYHVYQERTSKGYLGGIYYERKIWSRV